jgi:hypothetical protein
MFSTLAKGASSDWESPHSGDCSDFGGSRPNFPWPTGMPRNDRYSFITVSVSCRVFRVSFRSPHIRSAYVGTNMRRYCRNGTAASE